MRVTNVIPDVEPSSLKFKFLADFPTKQQYIEASMKDNLQPTKFKTSEGPIWWLNEFAKTNVGRNYRT